MNLINSFSLNGAFLFCLLGSSAFFYSDVSNARLGADGKNLVKTYYQRSSDQLPAEVQVFDLDSTKVEEMDEVFKVCGFKNFVSPEEMDRLIVDDQKHGKVIDIKEDNRKTHTVSKGPWYKFKFPYYCQKSEVRVLELEDLLECTKLKKKHAKDETLSHCFYGHRFEVVCVQKDYDSELTFEFDDCRISRALPGF